MEALPLRAGRANCMSNIQQDMIEHTLAILASMMQHRVVMLCTQPDPTASATPATLYLLKSA